MGETKPDATKSVVMRELRSASDKPMKNESNNEAKKGRNVSEVVGLISELKANEKAEQRATSRP